MTCRTVGECRSILIGIEADELRNAFMVRALDKCNGIGVFKGECGWHVTNYEDVVYLRAVKGFSVFS